jgi:copper chaperone CopZ
MRTKRTLMILLIGLLTLSAFAAKKSVTFNVMIADSKGEKAVKKALKAQPGVESVKADSKTGSVAIEYDDTKTDIGKLSNAFKSAGYYASPVGESCANKPGGCLNNAPTTTNTMR